MKHTSYPLAGLMALASGTILHAQTPMGAVKSPPPPALKTSAGVINDWLREQHAGWKAWNVGGEFRARYEYKSYFAVPGAGDAAQDFRANTPVDVNDYLFLRTRVHLGWTPCTWISFYAEGQNSSSSDDERNPNPGANTYADLFQGYVTLGDSKQFPLTAKIGRQTLVYGDERLIGVSDWDNIGRTFDAVKLRWEQASFWVDGFVSHPILPRNYQFDNHNPDDFFSGAYASSRSLIETFETQLYFLSDNASKGSPQEAGTVIKGNSPRDVYSVGTRWQSLPGKFGPVDLNAECVYQFGNFMYASGTPGVVNGERLDHSAWAAHLEGSYTFAKCDFKPRLALGFNYASGDSDPNDSQHGTFLNLFPSNHKPYGAMDFWSWQNMINPYASTTISPLKGLSLALTYEIFWLATSEDFFYQANGAPRSSTTGGYGLHPDNDTFAGQEIDLVATYAVKNFLKVQAGFGFYFTGSFINQSLSSVGGSHDATWVYFQAQLNL